VGKTGSHVWLAKELVEGQSVGLLIEQARTARKSRWRTALRVATQIARALEFTHRHRLIHANITPTNVLIPADGGPARLNDLGLWNALEGSVLQRQRLEKKLLAELPYLSPEHTMRGTTLDDLTDQYGLGAVVYALLVGRPPCEGGSVEEIMDRIHNVVPARPRDAQRTIPDEFQAAVLRMLAKRPEERYPGPRPLLADLEKVAAEHAPEG
jgi:serine/threonine-protein kinase